MASAPRSDGATASARELAACEKQNRGGWASEKVIDFDQYEEGTGAFSDSGGDDPSSSASRSMTLSTLDAFDDSGRGASGAGASRELSADALAAIMDGIADKLPASLISTFEIDPLASEAMVKGPTPIKGGSAVGAVPRGQTGASSPAHQPRGIAPLDRGLVMQALASAIARALQGDSMVTAPILHKALPWLGKITVTPGTLRGKLVAKHRTYKVQAQVLAGGHVLPWRIGREWRYSELRRLLVDDVIFAARRHGLEAVFEPLVATFPPKSWQNRNSDEIAEFRGSSIEQYIGDVVAAVSQVLRAREDAKKTKKGRRRLALAASSVRDAELPAALAAFVPPLAGESATDTVGGLWGGENNRLPTPRKDSLDDPTGEGLGEIITLIVRRLLNIDPALREDLETMADALGALITATPTDHCHVTKEFKITPQQAL
mmetsp:Transcript_16171/g.51662  ORF Transcript_16171/g.51662 Transcript_16171/m.51662 type:complete len:433 (+) Transcript_16171:645-1943(+)